ncbi:MAG: hypothetical protein PHD39_09160 [Methylobacter tundripaludum]|nr:hypothetical protein [Methylobacter tundripaludum]
MMPAYYLFKCPNCGYERERYRNMKKCPKCKGEFVRIEPENPDLAAAEQRGYGKGEEHGYACGWKQAMVAVENNGCSKLGMITIPISLLRLLSDKYLKEEGKNGKQI